jgi:hypothetical protein
MSEELLQQISKSIIEENTEELVELLKLDFDINIQYNYPIGCVRKFLFHSRMFIIHSQYSSGRNMISIQFPKDVRKIL